MSSVHPVERLRQIWTPNDELSELSMDLEPQSQLDSIIRDLFHRTILQGGPVTVSMDIPNTGMMRWEIVAHQPTPGVIGRTEASIWVQE